jgi:SAM-dependent methyltransferase
MRQPTDYDEIADRFAAKIDERPWNALYERPVTLSLLPTVRGKDVLDAGCGHGWYADWLASNGARVVAVDRSLRMVQLTEGRLAARGKAIQGALRDLRQILDDASIDLVLSSLVLHYIDDLAATFGEWARVLRPGGRLVLSTHHPTHDSKSLLEPGYLVEEVVEERWDWLGEDMRYYRRPLSALTEPLTGAGFVIERIVEPSPSEALQNADPESFELLRRLPAFPA